MPARFTGTDERGGAAARAWAPPGRPVHLVRAGRVRPIGAGSQAASSSGTTSSAPWRSFSCSYQRIHYLDFRVMRNWGRSRVCCVGWRDTRSPHNPGRAWPGVLISIKEPGPSSDGQLTRTARPGAIRLALDRGPWLRSTHGQRKGRHQQAGLARSLARTARAADSAPAKSGVVRTMHAKKTGSGSRSTVVVERQVPRPRKGVCSANVVWASSRSEP